MVIDTYGGRKPFDRDSITIEQVLWLGQAALQDINEFGWSASERVELIGKKQTPSSMDRVDRVLHHTERGFD